MISSTWKSTDEELEAFQKHESGKPTLSALMREKQHFHSVSSEKVLLESPYSVTTPGNNVHSSQAQPLPSQACM